MRKIKLEMDSLVVESFTTAKNETGGGTVDAHQGNTVHGQQCGSAYDACQTGLCTFDCDPTYSPDACPTEYAQYC